MSDLIRRAIHNTPAMNTLMIAILAVPLARLSAAPLALAWYRHR